MELVENLVQTVVMMLLSVTNAYTSVVVSLIYHVLQTMKHTCAMFLIF